ncbi:LOW QUALITY PROTEIN: SDR39U1 isoform 19, partial [Pongo abelii]
MGRVRKGKQKPGGAAGSFKAERTPVPSLLPALGVVLGRGGGAMGHMLLPFRLGLGGPIGSGHQFFPWIHIGDLAGILTHALEANHVHGVLNGVAPSSATNAEFAQTLGAALGRRAFIPLPSTVVQAVFG